jgi:O-antigen/teichoic acid export membrane protein
VSFVQKLRARLPQTPFVRRLAVIGGGTAIGQALSILASPVLGRLYRPEDFGQLAIYGSLTAVLGVVAGFGYHLAVQTAESDEDAAELVVVALVGVLLTAVVGGVAMRLLRGIIERFLRQPGLSAYLWIVPLGVVGLASYEVVSQWATRCREFGVVGRTTAERSLLQVALQLAGGFFRLGAMALIIAQLVGQWAGIYRVISATMRPSGGLFRSVNVSGLYAAAKRHRRFPLHVVPATLLYALDANSAPLIFAHFFDGAVVGLYALSHRLIAVPLWLIGTSAQKVFFPAAAEAHRNARLRDETFDTFRQLSKLVLPGTLILTLAGPEIFTVVFGTSWREAGIYVQWLAPRTGMVLLAFPLVPIVYVLDRQWVNTVFCALQLVLRMGGLLLGGHMGNARLGVALLSVGTGVLWFGYLVYLMALSGNGIGRVVKPLLKESLPALALAVPLVLAKLLHGSDLTVTLVAGGTCFVLAPVTLRNLSAFSNAPAKGVQ